MTDRPEFDGIGESTDPVDSTQTRVLQEQGRVDIPEEFHEYIGVGIGEDVAVVCKEDYIVVAKSDISILKEI